jgi:hypothetical protein
MTLSQQIHHLLATVPTLLPETVAELTNTMHRTVQFSTVTSTHVGAAHET